MNLINDPWIPIHRKNGKQALIAPWQITEKLGTNDEVVEISAPRPDFDGALIQFLIGLLQTSMTPKDEAQWEELLVAPPTPDALKKAFSSVSHAFETQGDNPRFMQDFEPLDVNSTNGISDLLIDAPGSNTVKENKDHFVKRDRVNTMCPICAATALFSLQTNAPSGGAGHRTSLRGGGPLTTLLVNDVNNSELPDTLWTNLWLNILDKRREKQLTGNWETTESKDIFPWLAPTRTSEKTGKDTFPEDTHPDQMYWAMPRRIRIIWDQITAGCCDVCGRYSEALVSHYKTKNYGINYTGEWQHPLSPYSKNKSGELLPRHPQPDGMTYRHWLSLVKASDSFYPAFVITRYTEIMSHEKLSEQEQLRLRCFGYDMDNMKARCWYETTFPLFSLENNKAVNLSRHIETLTAAATDVAGFVSSAIKEAWLKRPKDARGDTAYLKHAFFQQTEKPFYLAVKNLIASGGQLETDTDVLIAWHSTLRSSAYKLFNYWSDNGDFGQSDPKRISKAHQKLKKSLYSNKLCSALRVPPNKKEAS